MDWRPHPALASELRRLWRAPVWRRTWRMRVLIVSIAMGVLAWFPVAERVADMLRTWPLLAFALWFVAAQAMAVGLMRRVRQQATQGIWAALPIAPARIGSSLLLVAAMVWLILMAMTLLVFAALGMLPNDGGLLMLVGVASGVGVIWAMFAASRERAAQRYRVRHGWRLPASFDSPQLRGISLWQRRAVRQAWRGGSDAWAVGVLVLAMPAGTPPLIGIGLFLLAVLAIWSNRLLDVMRDAAPAIRHLLSPQPLPERVRERALRHWPLRAFTLAMLCGVSIVVVVQLAGGR